MINFTSSALHLSVDVAKALLQFASKDKSRPNLCGIGIENGDVCASDGFASVRFLSSLAHVPHDRKHFPRAAVEKAIKLAACEPVAERKVILPWSQLDPQLNFPFLSAVDGRTTCINCQTPISFDPSLFACMTLAAIACGTERVTLTNLQTSSDPVMFSIEGPKHTALVTISPSTK